MSKENVTVGIYMPSSVLGEIDRKRGRLSRSLYIVLLLEQALKENGSSASKLVNSQLEPNQDSISEVASDAG